MRIEQRSFDKSILLLLVPLAYAFWPWVAYRMPAKFPAAICVIWIILNFPRSRRSLRDYSYKRLFGWTILWYALACFSSELWALFGCGNFTGYAYLSSYLMSFFFLFVVYLLFRDLKFKEIKFVFYTIVLFSVLSSISALRGLGIEGLEGARATTGVDVDSVSAEGFENIVLAKTLGLGTYSHMYQNALIIAPSVLGAFYCKRIVIKILLVLLVVGSLIALRGGGLGTPYLVVVTSLGLSILALVFRTRKVIGFGTALIVCLLIIFSSGTSMFSWASSGMMKLAEYMDEGSVRKRVVSIAEAFSGDQNAYAFKRYQLQMLSLRTFCKNPIFGVGTYGQSTKSSEGIRARFSIGGHSKLLDTMARQGLVGTVPYIVFFIVFYRFCKRLGVLILGKKWLIFVSVYISGLVICWFANPMTSLPAALILLFMCIAFFMPECQMRQRFN